MKLGAKETKKNLYKKVNRFTWEDWVTIGLVIVSVGFMLFQIIRAKLGA